MARGGQKFMLIPRLVCLKWPFLRKIGSFFLVFLLIFAFGTLLPTVRNVILYPVWPYAWRPIGTLEILSIKAFTPTSITISPDETKCEKKVTPSTTETPKIKYYDDVRKKQLKDPAHSRFLPVLSRPEKEAVIGLYLVVSEALRRANIEFFMVEGSMLGAHRHQGIIPWDDDIDISVNVTQWRAVIQALGCIDGYVLKVTPEMHWKFFRNDTVGPSVFPFLDIFFYTENDNRIWAVARYLAQFVIFAKADVFPLTTAMFEGMVVPVPARTDSILRTLFDFDQCTAFTSNHRNIANTDKGITTVRCSSLTYLFDMHHLLS